MMRPAIKLSFTDFFRSFKELCFPPACLVCKTRLPEIQDLHLCSNCCADLTLITPPFCTCCGLTFVSTAGGSHLCSTCLGSHYFFNKARAVIVYNDITAKLIHSFKYNGSTAQFSTFKEMWKQSCLESDLFCPDLILPVPLHFDRLKERGFNQALILAEIFFAEQKEKINPHLLKRHRKTQHQTTLSGQARRKNLRNAFVVASPEKVRGKNIILLDDVFTTGTTVNECARILRQAGANAVQVLTLARVLKHR